jgi:type I restriction enzyme S subunit
MTGWREAALGDVCELYQPKTISSADLVDGGDYPVYGANGVIGRFDKFNHAEPQLLVTCRGATCGAVNVSQPNSWINGNAMVVKPRDASIELNYLVHMFKGGVDLSAVITGAAQPQITRQSLAPLKIRFPDRTEQLRIAAILDQADALRAKRSEALAQLLSLTQSIFIEMFGDPKLRIKAGSCRPLADCVAPGRIVTYGIVQAGPEIADGVPYIRTGDIKNGVILENRLSRTSVQIAESYSRSAIQTGDIVMSIRATVGTTALVPESLNGANLTQGTARISPNDDVHKYYLLNYLRTDSVQAWIQSNVKGATFREITLGKLRQLPVFIPSIDLQESFATRVASVNSLIASAQRALAENDALFSCLQHRAFRGEL